MVKCVVSGCPNRSANSSRGVLHRPAKRFFNFPRDPARVKVWLAALRETDKQDSLEQHMICEDHFLPEDVSKSGVNSDAIPIMPPYLDGPLGGMISPWGAESSDEEDQWAPGGCEEEEEEDDGADQAPVYVELPAREPAAVDPPQQDPEVKKSPEAKMRLQSTNFNSMGSMTGPPGAAGSSRNSWRQGVSLPQRTEGLQAKKNRSDVALGQLTQRFLELLMADPEGLVDLRQVTTSLQTRRRRVYDITNVLEGISVLERQSANHFKWIGSCPVSNLLWNQHKFQRELDNLKLVEETLDTLIKSCAQQLFDMTDDTENAEFAYVTHEDVSRLEVFQEQTVLVVKAPEETKLEVPAPKEDSIQVHLIGGRGPITVLTCDVGTREQSECFLTLEESRLKTDTLHTEPSTPQSAVQSA
ncbi:transcription factor E2F6 isoform X1 [Centropristis striata]|uniref:transcription factor E2F6 isoform X1 n=1 Tax=Centropristis striata TaxID=184440 RepID=UPI0027DFE6E6|nr:transcription factor E2F6 isoform X1 [Centropristis striata]